MSPAALELVDTVTSLVIAVYLWSSFFVLIGKWLPERVRVKALAVRLELKPFMLPAVLVEHLAETMLHPGESRWFDLGLNLLGWLAYRNLPDDDDRWKRRRKQAAERVSAVGGRLQVVPAD